MTSESVRESMDRFVAFINAPDEAQAGQLVHPGAMFHVPFQPEPLVGPSGYLTVLGMMRSGFPDVQWQLCDLVVEDGVAAARFVMRGTHLGAFAGVPQTGQEIEVQAMNLYRWKDGMIQSEVGLPDMFNLMRQIGALPK